MSGLGTCPKCSKTAMIRSGADRCTRCQRDDEEAARAAADAVPTPETPGTRTDAAWTPTVAVPPEISVAEGEMWARGAAALADESPVPKRRKKPYVKFLGRVIADQIDEDD